jgi:hypothetical protein
MKRMDLWGAAMLLCLGAAGGGQAADLTTGWQVRPSAGFCVIMPRSPILDLPTVAEMEAQVDQRFTHSLKVSLEHSTIYNRSPLFPWAVEAKAACGKAIGYFRGREVNEEMISKCDCYYSRMVSYLR